MLCDSNSLTPIRCLYPLEYFQYVVKSQVNFGCKCLPYFISQSGTHTRNWSSIFCIYHRRISDLSERLYCTSGRAGIEYPAEYTALWGAQFCECGDSPSSSSGTRAQNLLFRAGAYLLHS